MSQSQPSTRRLARRVTWETILALLVLIASSVERFSTKIF